MNPRAVNAISQRLSLRQPQKQSLEILDKVCDLIELKKAQDVAAALEKIKAEYPFVEDFERNFPSLCFALATGVGKTRLMGAFIAYLFRVHNIRHFFVLAPNLTIYNKLIADFKNPSSEKYVFRGISEFAVTPPQIITGDDYQEGKGVRKHVLPGILDDEIHVNIFNISKINTESRGGAEPRIKRLSEYIGESYFEYLSKLPDLVLLMDESHRYRAVAGMKAINELNPILGLELTATPQVEKASKPVPFKNVILNYPLAQAMNDGFVKEPAAATRENFKKSDYSKAGLEKLKLEDSMRVHEDTRVKLETYARQNNVKRVKPFMLVVARDVTHAEELKETIQSDQFFEGHYKGKVITVHSKLKGQESDETVEALMKVEETDNPVEIVIHVNMLKEGWDVTNLYTIVPLRAADSRTLVEQSIGRGLRLPYGKRTGVEAVDRLTIVAHDRFQDIIDEANREGSMINKMAQVIIGKDIPERPDTVVEVPSVAEFMLTAPKTDTPQAEYRTQPLFEEKPDHQIIAKATLEIIQKEYSRRPVADLKKPEIRKELTEKVERMTGHMQRELAGDAATKERAETVDKVTDLFLEKTIAVPRLTVLPKLESSPSFDEFELDTSTLDFSPVEKGIVIEHLRTHDRDHLDSGDGIIREKHLENYMIHKLLDYDDVNETTDSTLVYKLAGQAVVKLRKKLSDDELHNVLMYRKEAIAQLIHSQMEQHYHQAETTYEAEAARSFVEMGRKVINVPHGEKIRNFRSPVEKKSEIRKMVFGGFAKSLYPWTKFESDPERQFSVILEATDNEVLKWFRPGKGFLAIYHSGEGEYIPDFIVETKIGKWICEVKAADDMKDEVVLAKARAATLWCEYASKYEKSVGGKEWRYVLLSEAGINPAASFGGLCE